ncbi:MAG: hypothetical protein ACQEXJ_20440 [Myxococcota bacterium]
MTVSYWQDRAASHLMVALGLATLAGCAPIPLLQDAGIVRKGRTVTGFAGAVSLPLAPDTRLEPDGGGTQAHDPDLHLRPLPHVLGWARHGLGGRSEAQFAFHVPTFGILIGGKLGLVGPGPDAPFSLAVSGDVGASPVLGEPAWGGSLHVDVAPRPSWSLDATVRMGVSPGLWDRPALTAVLGTSYHGDRTLHFAAAGTADVGFGGAPAAYLLVGFSD